ncbi:MAG TPA: carboxypeptidase-like regulatory domain-containing protein [Terriglobia bacterium]|nr:carboxypeptidase-like regulatory domain-containing protein [Terriglobia bacterium]
MKTMVAGAVCISLIALLAMPHSTVSAGQDKPFANDGMIEGRVMRPGTKDGVADVRIVLAGPTPSLETWLKGVYSPKPELTPAMREEITRRIENYPADSPLESIISDILFFEAALMDLPFPTQNPRTNSRLPAPPQREVISDADGRFNFQSLPPGRYRVRAEREGYFDPALPEGAVNLDPRLAIDSRLARPNDATVVLTEKQPIADLTLRLAPGAVIGGRVWDPLGRPLVSYSVTAYRLSYSGGRTSLLSVRTSDTDDRGEYRLFWLPPGLYFVAAEAPRTATRPSRDAFARTFHPGERDPRLAPPIQVGDGANLDGIDIQVRADAILKISGRIVSPFVDAKGQPTSPAATMYLTSRNSNALDIENGGERVKTVQNVASTKAGGSFELRNVLPGSYDLWASAPDGKGATGWGRTRIDVTDRDLDNVSIPIKPDVEIKNHVSVDGAPYEMPASPPARTVGLRFVGRAMPQSVAFNTCQTFAGAKCHAPEGRYRVSAFNLPTRNAYVEDIRLNGVSIYDEGLDLVGAQAHVEVIIRTNGASVKGTVTDSEGHPFASALITLLPPQSRRVNPSLYLTTQANYAGEFAINGVPPGEYKALAWESVSGDAFMNSAFMEPFEQRGKVINVTPGPPTNVGLTVIPRNRFD